MFCRLCICQCNNEFNPLFTEDKEEKLYKLVVKYLRVEIKQNDSFSTVLCKACAKHLEDFDYFFQLVEEKQITLQKGVNTNLRTIKNEPPDEHDKTSLNINNEVVRQSFYIEEVVEKHINHNIVHQEYNFVHNEPATATQNNQTQGMYYDATQDFTMCDNEVFVKEEICSGDDTLIESESWIVSNEVDVSDPIDEQTQKMHSNLSLKCRICGTEAEYFEDAKNHLRYTHNVLMKDAYIICCGLRFYSQKPYDEHRQTIPTTFTCDICNQQLKSAKTLHFHKLAKHTDRQQYKYPCEICGERFMFRGALKEHVHTHSSKKPFKCDICNISYARLNYLKAHKKRHLSNNLRMKTVFYCEFCDRNFSCTENFDLHLVTQDDCLKNNSKPIEREIPSLVKVEHKCAACNKIFRKPDKLQRHLHVHSRQLKFDCSY